MEDHSQRLWLMSVIERLVAEAPQSPVPLQAHKMRDPLSWLGAMLLAHANAAAPSRCAAVAAELRRGKDSAEPEPEPPTLPVSSAEEMAARIQLIAHYAARLLPDDGFAVVAVPLSLEASGAATATNLDQPALEALLRHVLRTHANGTAQLLTRERL